MGGTGKSLIMIRQMDMMINSVISIRRSLLRIYFAINESPEKWIEADSCPAAKKGRTLPFYKRYQRASTL